MPLILKIFLGEIRGKMYKLKAIQLHVTFPWQHREFVDNLVDLFVRSLIIVLTNWFKSILPLTKLHILDYYYFLSFHFPCHLLPFPMDLLHQEIKTVTKVKTFKFCEYFNILSWVIGAHQWLMKMGIRYNVKRFIANFCSNNLTLTTNFSVNF